MAQAKKFKPLKAIRITRSGVVDDLLGKTNELTCVYSLNEIQSGRIEVMNTLLENKLRRRSWPELSIVIENLKKQSENSKFISRLH